MEHTPGASPHPGGSTTSATTATSIFRSAVAFVEDSITYETFADGSKGSILTYNVIYAISVGWLVPRRGSVFSLVELVSVVAVVVLLVTVLAGGSCARLGKTSGCIALPAANTSYLTLMTLCSFVVAFFATTVLQRWWTLRSHLQAFIGAGLELVMTVTAGISAELAHTPAAEYPARRAEAEALSTRLVGLLVVAYHILFNQARGVASVDFLRGQGHLTPQEVDLLASVGGGPLQVCTLLSAAVQDSLRRGALRHTVASTGSDAFVQSLPGLVSALRSNASMVMLYIEVQLPFPFVQIICAVAYAFLLQLVLVCAAYVAQGFVSNDQSAFATGYITVILYCFVLLGLLRLFEVLSNPLGDDPSDFPGHTYMKKYEASLKNVVKTAFALVDLQREGKVDVASGTGGGTGGGAGGGRGVGGTSPRAGNIGTDTAETDNPMHWGP